jgi:hypothetical protein
MHVRIRNPIYSALEQGYISNYKRIVQSQPVTSDRKKGGHDVYSV